MNQRVTYSITCLLAMASLTAVSQCWQNYRLTAGLLIAIATVLLLLRRCRRELILFAICAISGACAEVIAIRSGAWTYHHSQVLGIPLWLPILWGIAALFIVRTHEVLGPMTKKNPRS